MHRTAVVATVTLFTIGFVLARPFRLPEATWPVLGALVLVGSGAMGATAAWEAIERGTDVYCFLLGMMLLAELARREGLFDWLAVLATRHARGSCKRLFALVFVVGIVVTTFLSNDATAVVLTPAVAAATKRAKVSDALPYLLICAFVANAASFVLPISNPANLVVFGAHVPPLLAWGPRFAVPSILALGITFAALRHTQRKALDERLDTDVERTRLDAGGRIAAVALTVTAAVLLVTSAFGRPLGIPTFIAGTTSTIAVLVWRRRSPWPTLGAVSWSILPLVAGLFVIVGALESIGVAELAAGGLIAADHGLLAAFGVTAATGLGTNLVNNLPAGLLASSSLSAARSSDSLRSAMVVAIDLGPNLAVTGSLATLLWLVALRREGIRVSAWAFTKVGIVVTPPALAAAVCAALVLG